MNQWENKETEIMPISNEIHEDLFVDAASKWSEDEEQVETKTAIEALNLAKWPINFKLNKLGRIFNTNRILSA